MSFLKSFRTNTDALSLFVKMSNLLFSSITEREVERRSRLQLTDINDLAADIRVSYDDIFPENNLYGMSRTLNNYAGFQHLHHRSHCYIEHGLFFGDYISSYTYRYSKLRTVLTFSDYREKILRTNTFINDNLQIVKIGPYIQYAQPLLSSEEIKKSKETIGKTLLVFPSHSLPGETVSYDDQMLLNRVEEVKQNLGFDSVIVCLYWKDIQNGYLINECNNRGFTIVTAGHRYDPLFLNRLRTIIELSDYTMSNDIGTNLGYCICLKKPHYVFNQQIGFKEGMESFINREYKGREHILKSANEIKDYLTHLFCEPESTITLLQMDAVKEYWGDGIKLTSSDIASIYK